MSAGSSPARLVRTRRADSGAVPTWLCCRFGSSRALGKGSSEDGLLLLLVEGPDSDSGGGERRSADQPELRQTQGKSQPVRYQQLVLKQFVTH